MKFTLAVCTLFAAANAEHWDDEAAMMEEMGYDYDGAYYEESNPTLDVVDAIEEIGEGLQEVADSFYENPERFLTEIETTLVQGCYDDMRRQAEDMARGQAELEQGWEELTWRADVAGGRVRREARDVSPRWQTVQDFVDGLNEFGRDPSGYMDMGREEAQRQKQQQCDDFAMIMAEWKAKVLADLAERDEWEEGWNLAESDCVSGDAVDTFGDGCDWYTANPASCGTFDHELFRAADECCACGGGEVAECEDTNNGFGDVGGDQCDWYVSNPSSCGAYDTAQFQAAAMCCICGGGSTAEQPAACADTSYGAGDVGGDGCDWYAANPSACGSYDTPDFSAGDMCCACGGGEGGPLEVPEWNIDLDYDQAERYSEELEAAYRAHHERMADIITRWQAARYELDSYYWNQELLPVLAEGEKLDEKTKRALVTWIAEGTEIKGQPLVDVFPEVREWMLENYDPEGRTFIEQFRMEEMPMMLQEAEGPVTFSFHFDEAAINQWLEQEGRMYEQIDRLYQSTWQDYVDDMMPLWGQMGELNEEYKQKFEQIDETLQIQLEDTFADAQHWWEHSFTVSLAAKLSGKKGNTNYGMYAAIGATTLAALFIAGLAYKNKKQTDAMSNTAVSEALVN